MQPNNRKPGGPAGPGNGQQPDRKPIIKYYLVVLGFMLLLNWLILPSITQRQVTQVSYAQFDKMLQDKQVTAVQIGPDQITFSVKEGTQDRVYKSGVVYNPLLVDHRRQRRAGRHGQPVRTEERGAQI